MELFAIPLMIIAAVVGVWLAFKLVGVIGTVAIHIFRFIGGEVADILRILGGTITAIVFVPFVLFSVLIGRWSAAAHYGRAVQNELRAIGLAGYRCVVGHPLRLVGAHALVEGIERRVPEAVAAAPTRDGPSKRTGKFEGYTIIGSLAGGGSGGKLYVAEPDAIRRASFERAGIDDIDQVVIKSFSLKDGSSLPQIVRESRSLDAAKKLGLVLDHQLDAERFFYVMRFVPGDSLGAVTQRLHAESPSEGLDPRRLRDAIGYVADLARTLDAYHRGGLWHKDVKPDNIIVNASGAHLVDFGLVTPLRSAMTLTTHGTEYFRDPEMVKMALRGVKVQEVDGAKFDIYAAGAVLYAVVENSFPAHGALSQITRRCPDAVKWVIRRAMADYAKRYASSADMLRDLDHILRASDPFAVKPASLPSMTEGSAFDARQAEADAQAAAFEAAAVAAASPDARAETAQTDPRAARQSPVFVHAQFGLPRRAGSPAPRTARPDIRVTDWWRGSFVVDGAAPNAPAYDAPAYDAPAPGGPAPIAHPPKGTARAAFPRRVTPAAERLPAADQLRRARARVDAAQTRAATRRSGKPRRPRDERFSNDVNVGIIASVLVAAVVGGLFFLKSVRQVGERYLAPANEYAAESTEVAAPESPKAPEVSEVAAPAWAASFPEGLEGTALVISDFTPPIDPAIERGLLQAAVTLDTMGIELIGNVPGLSAPLGDRDAQYAMIAEVRHLRGLAPLASPDARDAIEQWLTGNEAVDLVVWLAPAEDMGSVPEVWVFGAPGVGLVTTGG